jgi:hypothetical protein
MGQRDRHPVPVKVPVPLIVGFGLSTNTIKANDKPVKDVNISGRLPIFSAS